MKPGSGPNDRWGGLNQPFLRTIPDFISVVSVIAFPRDWPKLHPDQDQMDQELLCRECELCSRVASPKFYFANSRAEDSCSIQPCFGFQIGPNVVCGL